MNRKKGIVKKENKPKGNAASGLDKDKTILAQVVALATMDFENLKTKYAALFGKEPPSRSRVQLVSRLAYRIQEIAYGGLSPEARERLISIDDARGIPGREKEQLKERKGAPTSGTKLVREYLGERHEVVVLDNGFQYRNGVYRSLSSIAREITGSHMSGPAFFGIRKKGGSE
jgi:hypothetical protein